MPEDVQNQIIKQHIESLPDRRGQTQAPQVSSSGYTTYIINEKEYQLSNDLTEEQKTAFFHSKLASPDTQSITTDSLRHDPDWLHASKVTYSKREGKTFTGTDAEAADYGINQMGWFNYNLPSMAVDANRMRTADPEEKRAFLHLMETYDKLGISWGGVGRALKGLAADPTTYVGLSTLGFGMAGSAAGKVLTKEGIKALLKTGVQGGMEGALWTGVQESVQQSARINAGGQAEFDTGKALGAAALGGVAGGVLSAGAQGLIKGAGNVLGKDAGSPVEQLVGREAGQLPGSPSVAAGDAVVPEELASQAVRPIDAPVQPAAIDQPAVKPGDGAAEVTLLEQAVEPRANTLPASPPTNDVIEAIRGVAGEPTGVRDFPRIPSAIAETVEQPVELLLSKSPREVAQSVEELRRWASTGEQEQLVGSTLMKATRALDEEGTKALDFARQGDLQALERLDQIDAMRSIIKAADTDLSSMSGTRLGERANNQVFNTNENRGLTVEDILKDKGINPEAATPEQKLSAQADYYDRYQAYLEKAQKRDEIKSLEADIETKFEADDISGALLSIGRRSEIIDGLLEQELIKGGVISRTQSAAKTGLKGLNEYIISTVFSPATIVANTLPAVLKTAYTPFLQYVAHDPLSKIELRRMTSTYGAMFASTSTALRAAQAAFKYERSLLSLEGNRVLENGTVIPGLTGRLIRTFPRILNTTDEFFAQVNYRGFVVGQATADAVEVAAAKGLKGADADAFVDARVQQAVAQSFADKPDAVNTLAFLKHQGEARGLTGERLDQWVRTELNRNGELLKEATDRAGRDYADDLLFKRRFSGENGASTWAQRYEAWVNENPWMRLVGQLFFRTPVRVFEEGIRLTPGLNLLSHVVTGRSSIISDLNGLNGPVRQMRAQGESMLSMAFAGSVAMLYAQGRITGGGPTDHKQKRGLEDGKQWEPYTLKFSDGSTFSFRNLDPFATPFKIMVNALDKLSVLQYRKAQGEYVDDEMKLVGGHISAATLSVAQAIKDANLMGGVDQIVQMVQIMSDPENKENALSRFAGQKLQLAIPAVVSKSSLQDNPVLANPVSWEQYIRAKVNPSDPLVAKQYDQLGNVRTLANPASALLGLNFTTKEQREAGRTAKELRVLRELNTIELASSSSFAMPPRFASVFGDIDLRTKMTEDGKETLFDRLQRYYRETPVIDLLDEHVVSKPHLSYGTKSQDGTKAQVANKIIEGYRELAANRLLQEETNLFTERLRRERLKGDILGGGKDVGFRPYK
ncbi:hypothetical protein OCOJLMKI_0276 [Methylobacterium iners]|uniref:Large polyvalent protein associated domain-containing protein n=2 Tax=Methylobacterium iners TaxID=418707 RepID=A0ABQ4RTP8_9HYPH|nr:hypothetical protein OCOJLMKI_0276 [Methylobacterium iners]